MKILCWIGIHKWFTWDRWTPSFDAKFIRRFEMWSKCNTCGKIEKTCDKEF